MKKIVLLIILSFGIFQANAQCPYTYTLSGNTASFNAQWAIIGTQVVDSVVFNFGDGSPTLNTTTNPTLHTYPGPGTYNTCLTRYISTLGQPGQLICTYCDSITIQGTSTSCFVTAGYNSTVSGLSVSFSNTTMCNSCTSLTNYWDYGDGNNSTSWQGIHTYSLPGTYTVCLYETGVNANNVTCIDTFCSTITVGSTTGCMVSLSHTLTGPVATFSPTVSGGSAPYTYFYDYNDGTTGASNVHTYTTTGVYFPCVTVTDANNISCTACDSFAVNITPPPSGCVVNASFSESITGLNVNFINNSTITNGTITSTNWSFGDGGTSGASSPVHSYTAAGNYTVNLVVVGIDSSSNFCADSASKVITVGPSAVKDARRYELNVYPNPTTNIVMIEIPSGQTLKNLMITDVAGRKIAENYSLVKNNILSVSLKNQSSGIYFIKLQTNDQFYTSSIMKQD